MSLKDTISEDIKAAMKARDKVRLETVRSIKKLLLEKEVDARGKGKDTLSADDELSVLTQLAKQRREAITQYDDLGRTELAEQERQELLIIEEYLPKQLSEHEVKAVVAEIIEQVGASSSKDMGKVMGQATGAMAGQADGKVISGIVRKLLS